MKIKIPLVEINTDDKCPCNNYKEYELKLKCMRAKLHSKYIACISIGIVIWVLATGQANTEQFSEWISFASTVASIILSVIAIILSITGESKTDAMREQMEDTAKKLDEAVESINEANGQNINNIEELKESIKIMQKTLEAFRGETAESFSKFEKTTDRTTKDDTTIKENFEWVQKK